jgi:hypothetical protein
MPPPHYYLFFKIEAYLGSQTLAVRAVNGLDSAAAAAVLATVTTLESHLGG